MGERTRDYMAQEFTILSERLSLREALVQMVTNMVEMCVVVGKNKRIVGIMTELDLIRRRKDNLDDVLVGNIISNVPIITMSPNDFMEDVAELVNTYHNIDQVVIEERGQPLGVIRKLDILRWMHDQKSK